MGFVMISHSDRSSAGVRLCLRLLRLVLVCGVLVSGSALLSGGPLMADGKAPAEPVRWLQEYLRLDTTNPPGNEHLGAGFLARILVAEGIQAQLLVTPEGRTSVYARLERTLPGRGGDDALLLLHHVDVVPPGPDWTREPFSGAIEEGALWGRGAIDAKSLGIAHLAALVELQRRGVPRIRDVVFLGVADEESGGGRGTAWLLEHHPELFRGIGTVLNEGGANRLINGRLFWWGIEVDQKRPLWLRVSTRGRPGHASGLNPHSASHKLVKALAGLLEMPPRYHVADGARTYLEAVAPLHPGKQGELFRKIDQIVEPDGFAEPLMPGMAGLFLDTVQVTVLEGSDRINTIAARAEARIDIRLLPDTDTESFLQRVREALGPRVEVEVLLSAPPGRPSSTDDPLFRALEGELGGEGPVVPTFISGFTDSRFFRQRGIVAYGFSPFLLPPEQTRTIHAADERISLRELEKGVQRMIRIVALHAAGYTGE